MRPLSALLKGRLARFLGVGAVNTAIDFAIYTLLAILGVPILLANLVSTSAGLTFSFVANRRFTFGRTGRPSPAETAAFVLVTGFGLWVIQPVILVACDRVLTHAVAPALVVTIGKLLAIGVGIGWNWLWYSRVLFRASAVPAAEMTVSAAAAQPVPVVAGYADRKPC